MKRCTKCKENKSSTDFHRTKATKDGLHTRCKKCRLEHYRNKYNSEDKQKYNRLHYQKNKEKILEQKRIYHQTHREQILKVKLQYQRDNPTKVKEREQRRRARKLDRLGYVSPNIEEILLFQQQGVCYYCGAFVADGWYHWEHKTPLARGGYHTNDNLVLACPPCNFSKGARTEEEFKQCLGYQERNEKIRKDKKEQV
jgi:5-methylcytosine-specific restriction endonuclease McrA